MKEKNIPRFAGSREPDFFEMNEPSPESILYKTSSPSFPFPKRRFYSEMLAWVLVILMLVIHVQPATGPIARVEPIQKQCLEFQKIERDSVSRLYYLDD